MIKIKLIKKLFVIESESNYQNLNSKGFGFKTEISNLKYQLNLYEVLFLLEKKKIELYDTKNNKLSFDDIVDRFNSKSKNNNIDINYLVYKDLKKKGYLVKSGLKFGFTFRVYDKGIKLGEDHALWLVEPSQEFSKIKINELTSKARTANTTRKKMILAIIDTESEISYFEINWKRL